MPRRSIALIWLAAFVLTLGPARADLPLACGGPVVVTSSGAADLRMDNGCIFRQWIGPGVTTTRTGSTSGIRADFAIELDGARVTSDLMLVNSIDVAGSGTDHARITWHLLVPGVAEVTRTVDGYAGIAGLKSQTTLRALAPVTLSGYTLDEVAIGGGVTTLHEFRAGSDWREPGWTAPGIGDPHAGDWHVTKTAADGSPISGTAEWISAVLPEGGRTVAIVNERRDYSSSVASFDAQGTLSAGVDFSRDIVYTGPFEESIHAENPTPGPARHRALFPGRPLILEPGFTIFARDADDELWQFHKYLTQRRLTPYPKSFVFNSDGVDSNAISTGAKDDMNFERFQQILPEVREMGVDTFIFDDGWMARAGDWCPDSPQCPEPRWDGVPGSKFRPRFHDESFAAVRELLAGDPADPADDIALGLWMNAMSFHPSSKAFKTNPQWSCLPVGTATGAVSIVDPNGSSNEAGIGLWNPLAMGVHPDDPTRPIRMIDYLQERILRAIEVYGSRYFKFDFLVWVDCGGAEPVTMYEYHDAFVDMIDRLQAKHPEVTYEVDETNDYRMFPFESVARGPSWFLNGSPAVSEQLHAAWNLAPYVPGSSLGMRTLKNGTERRALGIDKAMAASLVTHTTFSFPVDTDLTPAERAQVRRWADFYETYRDELTSLTFPLLGDPRLKEWTALQPWNLDTASGWLLVYRQSSATQERSIPLRGLAAMAGPELFRLTRFDPADGSVTDLGLRSAAELRAGVSAHIPDTYGYAFIRVSSA